MLVAAGATEPVENTPNQQRNPLVDLPVGDAGTALLESPTLAGHPHAQRSLG